MTLYALPRAALEKAANLVLDCRWVPQNHKPHPKQMLALLAPHREVFFGGAAGGGKSDLLLSGALQFADVPSYHAIIFRRTFADLSLPGALMDRAHEWLANTGARWNSQRHFWTFPSGAKLQFAYMDKERDELRYQSADFQYIGWDELSHWPTDVQYIYLYSRLRRTKDQAWMPLRCRSASNPGGPGHQWLLERFIKAKHPERLYIPSRIADNPALDEAEYDKSLAYLDKFRREQLKKGNWHVRPPGELFDTKDFRILPITALPLPDQLGRPVRFWDLAGSDPDANPKADWTAGVKMIRDGWGNFWVLDVQRFRARPAIVEKRISASCDADGWNCRVRIHRDPAQAGEHQAETYATLLAGYNYEALREGGSKYVRAQPYAGAVGAGLVNLIDGPWVEEYLAEMEAFGPDPKLYAWDDQVDASSSAFSLLASEPIPGSLPAVDGEQLVEGNPDMREELLREMMRRGMLEKSSISYR